MATNIEDVLDDDTLLIDEETGFAVNVPAELQKPVGWWVTFPDAYKRIKEIRKALNLTVVDDLDGSIAEGKKSLLENLFGEDN